MNEIRTRIKDGKKEIFDPIRKRFVSYTPEEGVRQSFIHYLINVLSVPPYCIAVEKRIRVNQLDKRFDIVVYKQNSCKIIVECKAPCIKIDEKVLHQIAVYNSVLDTQYLVLFNGKQSVILTLTDGIYVQTTDLPSFEFL